MGTLPEDGTVSVERRRHARAGVGLLADVTRAGEWSHETQGGEWLDGATARRARRPLPRPQRERPHEVVARVRGAWPPTRRTRISWRTVPTRLYPDSTRWTYEIDTDDGGAASRSASRC